MKTTQDSQPEAADGKPFGASPVRLGSLLLYAQLDRRGWWYTLKNDGRLDVFLGIGRIRTASGWVIYKCVLGPLIIGVAPINQEPIPMPNTRDHV